MIADIHANDHALEAVLEDILAQKVDMVVVNGDMVNRGPNNVAVLERLLYSDFPFSLRFTMGNHDDLMRKWVERDSDIPVAWFDDPFWQGMAWSAAQIAAAGLIPALCDLPMTQSLKLPQAPSLLISHGSPRHYREGYGEYLTDETLSEILEMHPADILIGSHTHRPLQRRWGKHTVLNSGAVGTPFNGDPRAQYLLLHLQANLWQVEFRAVDYDRAAALAAFEDSGMLAEGGVSARIFYEELRSARPLYMRFWMWTEQSQRRKDGQSWQDFCQAFPDYWT